MLFYLILLIFFAWYCRKIIKLVNSIFAKYAKFHATTPLQHENFAPFMRDDFPKWSKLKFYIVAIIFLPLRLFLIILLVLTCFLVVKILFLGVDIERPILGFRRKMVKMIVSSCCRIILFLAGLYKITIIEEKINDYLPNYTTNKEEKQIRAPLIVCNHVSWVDTLYLMSSRFSPSFLAKEEVSHIPVIGFVAKILQAFFVDRESRTNKDLILKKIGERCKIFKTKDDFPQLLIFPEGTNTNGKSLISFKRGAFHDREPLQIICLEYPFSQFNLMIDDFGMAFNILVGLCVFQHSLRVHVFDVFDPKYLNLQNQEEEWEKIAETVRDIMAKCLNAKKYSFGYRDSLEFTEFLMNHDVIQTQKINFHNESSPEKKNTKENKKNI